MISLFKTFASFKRDEDGAVTVDWVVLTAAIVGLAVFIGNNVLQNVDTIATGINTDLEGYDPTFGEGGEQ